MLTSLLLLLSSLLSDPCDARPGPRAAAAEIRAEVAALGASHLVGDYLVSVARRESSLRPWVMHRLPADVEAARAAWRRLRSQHRTRGNPWANDMDRWTTIGLFGLNSNYYAPRLGARTDPRELCRASSSVRAYVYAARAVLKKMRRCVSLVRMGDIHRAVQGGRVCPRRGEDLRGPLAWEVVTAADFGTVTR